MNNFTIEEVRKEADRYGGVTASDMLTAYADLLERAQEGRLIMTILVFDTETTGLPDYKQPSEMPHQPHIVELFDGPSRPVRA